MSSKYYWAKVWIVTAVISFLAHYAVKRYYSPAYDGNLTACKLLDAGDASGSYESMRDNAAQAFQIASNPDIKKLADFWHRISAFYVEHGVSTYQEGKSCSGAFKMIIAGLNPFVGVKATGFFIEGVSLEPAFKRTEAWYHPQLQKEVLATERANAESIWAAAMVFIFIPLIASKKRVQISKWLDSGQMLSQAPKVAE